MDEVWCVNLGQVPYEPARELQKRLEAARHAGEIPDLLLLLEHPPTYTRGRRSDPSELPMGVEWYERQGIEVRDTDRGGRVTYHGPGQLVGYPIMSLRAYGDDVNEYLRRMERVMVGSLGAVDIDAGTIDGLTGVWAGDPAALAEGADADSVAPQIVTGAVRKIGSIGVHVSRGITTHGFAINVSNGLEPFEWIVPCGIDGCRMTSVSRELGAEQPSEEFAEIVVERFGDAYERRPVAVESKALDSLGPAVALNQ